MDEQKYLRPRHQKPYASFRPSEAEAPHPLSDYMVPSNDSQGRSVSVRTSVPPMFRRLCTKLITRKPFPFETEGDVLRWCIFTGLRLLSERANDEEITAEMAVMDSWSEGAKHELEMTYYDGQLKKLMKVIDLVAAKGHLVRARNLAEKIWRDCDKLYDDYWADLYRAKAKRKVDEIRKKLKNRRRVDDEDDSEEVAT